MCNCHDFLHSDSPVGTFFFAYNRGRRRKERKVEDVRQHLIEAGKELAVEELPKRDYPATKKRGADPTSQVRSSESLLAIQKSKSLNMVWKAASKKTKNREPY
jgi:hypothetical protein